MSKLHRINDTSLVFHCPGCNEKHQVYVAGEQPVWGWNGSMGAPTFTPSILIRSGCHVPYRTSDKCWCTYNAEHPDAPAPFTCFVCHSFVVNGSIQFLTDCTHSLAGRTVTLPEWEDVP